MNRRFQEVPNLIANEPVEILQALDSIPDAGKLQRFPNYQSFLPSNPSELLPILKEGISRENVVERCAYAGVEYRTVSNSTFWNSVAITCMNSQNFDESIAIFEEMVKIYAPDSATLTNHGVSLLNKLISKHKMEPADESDFEMAKDLTFRAFMFDVKAEPKKNLVDVANFPAFKNAILIRNIEAELYSNKKLCFIAFLLGWISVEMSLVRLWCKFMQEQGKRKGHQGKTLSVECESNY